jgi:predicted alpha/beta-hydrolase family hydrolase
VPASVSLDSTAVRIYLAHGASGNIETIRPWASALRQRGFDAQPVGLPRGTAERAVPVYRELLERAAQAARLNPATNFVIGGHSFGGRVASMVAADQPVLGLVLLSYPLHRPGHPELARVDHWSRITCPVLLLSGEADPFARIDLLRKYAVALPDAELFSYAGVGHGLVKVMDDALNRTAEFLTRLAAAEPRPG